LCKNQKGEQMATLTKAFVKRAKCDDGKAKQEFYDDTLKGFMLEVRANGRKTFFLKSFTSEGKVRKRGLTPKI
jgi:hypothetical protein